MKMRLSKPLALAGLIIIVFYLQYLIWQRYRAENSYNKAKKITIPAFIDAKIKRNKQILMQLERAIKLNPLNSKYHFALGEAYLEIAQDKELIKYPDLFCQPGENILSLAQDNYLAAISLEPTNGLYRLKLGLSYVFLGEVDRAQEEFHKATKLDFTDALIHYKLANYYASYFDKSKLDKVYDEYKSAILFSSEQERLNILQEIYTNFAQDYLQIKELLSEDASAMYAFAMLLVNKIKYDEAIEIFRESIILAEKEKRNDVKADSYIQIGVIQTYQQKFDQADKSFKKALEITPNHAGALRTMGWNYLGEGEFNKAKDVFERSLEIEPREGWACYGLAKAYEELNLKEEAINYYKKALRLGLGDSASEETLVKKLESLKE